MWSWTWPLTLQWPFEVTTWPWKVTHCLFIHTSLVDITKVFTSSCSISIVKLQKVWPLMTSGDLVNEVIMQNIHKKQVSILLQLLWKFRKPNYTEWWFISKNVQFQHKNWHKSAILRIFKIEKWRASMGHIGLSSCQVWRKSIQQFLRSDPERTDARTDWRTDGRTDGRSRF